MEVEAEVEAGAVLSLRPRRGRGGEGRAGGAGGRGGVARAFARWRAALGGEGGGGAPAARRRDEAAEVAPVERSVCGAASGWRAAAAWRSGHSMLQSGVWSHLKTDHRHQHETEDRTYEELWRSVEIGARHSALRCSTVWSSCVVGGRLPSIGGGLAKSRAVGH